MAAPEQPDAVAELAIYRAALQLDTPWTPPGVTEAALPTTAAELVPLLNRAVAYLLWEREAEHASHCHHHDHSNHPHHHHHHELRPLEEVAAVVARRTFADKRRLLQALLTVRPPGPRGLPADVHTAIDTLLQAERRWRGVVADPPPTLWAASSADADPRLVLWRGDITTLAVDCIVNAANAALLGCFQPHHPCIDNAIHCAAGPRLRDDCATLVQLLGLDADADGGPGDRTGTARATRAYNLPSRFVLHTVGPIIERARRCDPAAVTPAEAAQLAACYRSCLDVAAALPDVRSIAFCCISTGMFGFPQQPAAHIAVRTVREWLAAHPASTLTRIVFNVFQPSDAEAYAAALAAALGAPGALDLRPDRTAWERQVARARAWLADAECVLIAGGAGLSAAAGLDYTDRALFARLFPAMHRRGFQCMYEFIGYRGWTPALQWGYLLAQVDLARYRWPLHTIYHQLRELATAGGGRDYFVLTSNADGLFERHGFDPARIYTAQGDYSRLQCLTPCRRTAVWPTRPFIDRALPHIDRETQEITDPAAIPACPHCGGPVMLNVRGGDWFIEEVHLPQRAAYRKWLAAARGRRLVIVEVGAGFNTPSVVRWPCEEAVAESPQARLIRINRDHPQVLAALLPQAVELGGDAADAVAALAAAPA